MNLPECLQTVLCKSDFAYFWNTERKIKKWTWYHHSYKRVSNDYTWIGDHLKYVSALRTYNLAGEESLTVVRKSWTMMTDDEAFSYCAELKACRAEMVRQKRDQLELDWRHGIEAKMKRRMRFKNPIKAIERLDARITNLVRYWNAYGCDQYIANMITHFNGLKESLAKYRIDQEELALEAFKPSRVEYSLSCA